MSIPTTKQRLGPLGSPQRVVRFFALVMGLVYVALGGWFIYTASQPTPVGAILPLGHTARIILGSVFILYGLYRLISTLRSQFRTPPIDEAD